MPDNEKAEQIGQFLNTPDLADALESDQFKQFLDQVPIAIAVAELKPSERIVYANLEFERLSEMPAAEVVGKSWDMLACTATASGAQRPLSEAIVEDQEYIGLFVVERGGKSVNVWSNVIEDDGGEPLYRLVALAAAEDTEGTGHEAIVRQLQDRDTLLRELQHRVKNNLQMITALIRMEARNLPDEGERFDRLAGRVESLALLYESLSEQGVTEEIDLGIYLSQVASAVMRAHAVEGIRLDLKVDTWPVSINVAMPTGLVVNELLMNALKHAFKGRDGGTITLHSLVDDRGCSVIVADDGVGLPEGAEWPQRGKLSALIVKSLRQNAHATVEVHSDAGKGLSVTMRFTRNAAAAEVKADSPAGS